MEIEENYLEVLIDEEGIEFLYIMSLFFDLFCDRYFRLLLSGYLMYSIFFFYIGELVF